MASTTLSMIRSDEVQISQRRVWIVLLFLFGILIYTGLPSGNLNGNDYIELLAVQSNDAERLYDPNHLLFRPLVNSLYYAQDSLGLDMSLTDVGLRVVSLSAIASLVLFYIWVARLVKSNFVAVAASIGFGISWVVWFYSTGTMYFMFSVAFVLVALNLLLTLLNQPPGHLPAGLLIMMGMATAISILFWQMNIFFVPSILLVLYLRYRQSLPQTLKVIVVYLAAAAIVGLIFLIPASVQVLNARGTSWNLSDFIVWGLSYNSNRLSIWGVWDIARIPPVALSALGTIVPAWAGLGLRPLLHGDIQPDKLIALFSLVALGVMLVLPVIHQLRRRSLGSGHFRFLLLLALGSFFYIPFMVWWDPTDPHWLFIPLIAFWTGLAVVWQPLMRSRIPQLVLAVSIALIALANFSRTIWPHHADANPLIAAADCLVEVMKPQDMYVGYQYDFSETLRLYYGQNAISLIDNAAKVGVEPARADYEVMKTQVLTDGGVIYIRDPSDMDADTHFWSWLDTATSLTHADIESIVGDDATPAIQCGDYHYLRINS